MTTASTSAANNVRPSTSRPNLFRQIFSIREMPVFVALIALVLITWALNPRFLTAQGIKDLFLNATIAMLMAAGQSLIISSEGVDLSVGSILGFSAFFTGILFVNVPNIPIIVVFIAGTLLGALLGAINGLLVTKAKVPAMVITLGTLYVFRGALNWWAGSTQYFAGDRPKSFGDMGVATVLGFPVLTILAIVVVVLVSLYQKYARSGRDLYAIGSDRAAAAVYGIPVGKRVFAAFVANGALVGLGGVLYASRFNSVGATTGTGMELDIVAACVVGGVAITGGVGTAYGAAIGALLLNTITSALTAIGVDKFWQRAVVGVLIIVAILVDRVSTIRRQDALRKKGGAGK
ncbi:ABC transporter permease [Schaalia sp. ZJ405]|uniref:ABC transporter permease n=1 Tax=unclassified Schaalia TaxID=2691889 RepID=UPI0013EB7DA8|nr:MULTISPECIES: ABC transporter permease [unclassified Schaalia]QPK81250.1 ABC transporter permease [Schaalia sp. ZJ405]